MKVIIALFFVYAVAHCSVRRPYPEYWGESDTSGSYPICVNTVNVPAKSGQRVSATFSCTAPAGYAFTTIRLYNYNDDAAVSNNLIAGGILDVKATVRITSDLGGPINSKYYFYASP